MKSLMKKSINQKLVAIRISFPRLEILCLKEDVCIGHKCLACPTYKGLFRYTRLPFGIATAPLIFQKTIESIIQGMGEQQVSEF